MPRPTLKDLGEGVAQIEEVNYNDEDFDGNVELAPACRREDPNVKHENGGFDDSRCYAIPNLSHVYILEQVNERRVNGAVAIRKECRLFAPLSRSIRGLSHPSE